MKLSKKIVAVLLLTVCCFALVSAESNDSITLSQSLESAKTMTIQQRDTITTQVRNNHQNQWLTIASQPDYQALLCLGILEPQTPEQHFEEQTTLLRHQILQTYLDVDSRIRGIELGLPIDQTKLQSDIQNFTTHYETILNQLSSEQEQYLNTLQNNINAYSAANRQLLDYLYTQMVAIDALKENYHQLQKNLTLLDEKARIGNVSLEAAISNQRNLGAQALEELLSATTRQRISRHSQLLGLDGLLKESKNHILTQYQDDLVTNIHTVISQRYPHKNREHISQQIQDMRTKFYRDDTIHCPSILTSTTDVQSYVQTLMDEIHTVGQQVGDTINMREQEDPAEQVQQSMFAVLQQMHSNHNTYRQQLQQRISQDMQKHQKKIKEQEASIDQLSEKRQQYNAMLVGNQRDTLREQIIEEARDLYHRAASQSLRTQLNDILKLFGVDMQSIYPNAHGRWIETENQFFPLVARMASRYSTEAFMIMMEMAISTLQTRIAQQTPSQAENTTKIIEAIELYINP